MTSNRAENTRIAMEYLTARASRIRDEASEEALEDASAHVYELVGGLTGLLVSLARRAAAAEGSTVEHVLQEEALTLIGGERVVTLPRHQEVAAPDAVTHELEISTEDDDLVPVRVKRLETPEKVTRYLEIDEDDDMMRPGEWDA